MNGERVHATGQFTRKNAVNQPVALQPGLPFERVRHNINTEMGLPTWSMPGMACMLVRFVHHLETLRREGRGQLLRDHIGGPHAVELRIGASPVNGKVLERVIGKGA